MIDVDTRSRMERYLAMKRQEARIRHERMIATHGSLWLDCVAATRDDAIGEIIGTNYKYNTVEVELFNRSGRVRFNSLDFYGIPAKDLWVGDCIAKVPT